METATDLGTLVADKLLLERAILNVISNALDYSPPDGTIHVVAQKSDGIVQISVTDEGRGFTPEALSHAREQFFMEEKSLDLPSALWHGAFYHRQHRPAA